MSEAGSRRPSTSASVHSRGTATGSERASQAGSHHSSQSAAKTTAGDVILEHKGADVYARKAIMYTGL